MFYVIFPICDARVAIPASVCSPDHTVPFNIAHGDDSDRGFDYDDEDIDNDDGPPAA